jgi:hypothetical protein
MQPYGQPMPQFMGYDPTGKPVYSYPQPGAIMPQFMGYDQAGHPIYAQPAMPQGYPQVQQPAQPVVQQQLVQPMMQQPVMQQPVMQQPVQPAVPQTAQPQREIHTEQGVRVSKISVKHEAEEMPQMVRQAISNSAIKRAAMEQQEQQEAAERRMREPDVHVSKIVHDAAEMPEMIRNAMEKAASAPQENIFDQQERPSNDTIMDSVEDVLSSIGEDTSKYKKKPKPAETAAANIQYEEYKPKNRRSTKKKGLFNGSQENNRPLTKEELRDQKRREKIDAQFKKDLAKRGF